MKFLLILLFSLFSLNLLAQESCDQMERVERHLERLRESCGSGICSASDYIGSTVENAIINCMSSGRSRSNCAYRVSCGNRRVCSASDFSGATIEDAITNCMSSGRSRSNCAYRVTCEN